LSLKRNCVSQTNWLKRREEKVPNKLLRGMAGWPAPKLDVRMKRLNILLRNYGINTKNILILSV